MTEARSELRMLLERDDLYQHEPEQIADLQLEAAREAFAFHRERIPVLDQRARDTGVHGIESLHDIVPLLFSHTTYKSYPQSFVEQRRWDRMTAWFSTLTSVDVGEVNLSAVNDIDGWFGALEAAGHRIFTSSGTSGKTSFFNNTQADLDVIQDGVERLTAWPRPVPPTRNRRMYRFSPARAPSKFSLMHTLQAQAFANPDDIHLASAGHMRIAEMQRAGSLRRALAAGTATPEEIADAQTTSGANPAKLIAFIDDLLDHRHEPLFVAGPWSQQWTILQRARERGIPAGDFHPETLIGVGGGTKGADLPSDYEQQVFGFYGDVYTTRAYGMTEVSTPCHACEERRYHRPPTLLLLMLDRPGEQLLNVDAGVVEGRVALLDVSLDGRWGGVITGDRAEVDFSPCPCGRPGPTIVTIGRYADMDGDDKIECSAAIDAYVREALAT